MIGGFFLLRFLNPAIVTPHGMRLLKVSAIMQIYRDRRRGPSGGVEIHVPLAAYAKHAGDKHRADALSSGSSRKTSRASKSTPTPLLPSSSSGSTAGYA